MIPLLGALWWWVFPVRKALAIANLGRSFPDADPQGLRTTVGAVAWSYVHLLLGRSAQIEGLEHVPKTGCICLAGHGRGWDLALVSAARRVPITIFVKRPSNALAAWLIDRLRAQADLELLPPSNAMAAAYGALERGRMVVFVQDQRHNPGPPVPFFGQPAHTSAAFASMVHRTRAPVVGAWPRWSAAQGFHARFAPVPLHIPEDRDAAIPALGRASQAWIESQIRLDPLNWWWLHNRWRAG